MPSNLLRFDAEYVSELTSRMNLACDLMAEAVENLKSAQNHDNWKCKERTRILDDFDELNAKLGRLNSGVNETTRILGNSVSRFAALESQYDSQAESLSDELTANHGYAASVRTDEPSSTASQTSQTSQTEAAPQASSEAQASAESSESDETTATGAGHGRAGRNGAGGHGAGAASAIAGQIAGRGRHNTRHSQAGQESQSAAGGSVTMNVNLPVTHVPDNPDAAARGTKDAKAAAQAAVNMTVHTITLAFTGYIPEDLAGLAEAYNAGRSIFENSAIIIAAPTQAHTAERLAMASGLVNLAGNNSLGQAAASAAGAESSGGNISAKARNLLSAFQGNSESGELSNVLGVLAGSSSESVISSSGGGSGKSFFEEIIEALKKVVEGSESSSVSSESSPVTEFLNNFVMDQV